MGEWSRKWIRLLLWVDGFSNPFKIIKFNPRNTTLDKSTQEKDSGRDCL